MKMRIMLASLAVMGASLAMADGALNLILDRRVSVPAWKAMAEGDRRWSLGVDYSFDDDDTFTNTGIHISNVKPIDILGRAWNFRLRFDTFSWDSGGDDINTTSITGSTVWYQSGNGFYIIPVLQYFDTKDWGSGYVVSMKFATDNVNLGLKDAEASLNLNYNYSNPDGDVNDAQDLTIDAELGFSGLGGMFGAGYTFHNPFDGDDYYYFSYKRSLTDRICAEVVRSKGQVWRFGVNFRF